MPNSSRFSQIVRYAICVLAVFTALSRLESTSWAVRIVGCVSLIVLAWLIIRFAIHISPFRPPAAIECEPPVPEQWRAINSPTDRVPSHGTYAFAQAHSIDLIDADNYPTQHPRDLTLYPSFGVSITSPVAGVVVSVVDRVTDHPAVNGLGGALLAQLRLLGGIYLGVAAILGNHVIIKSGSGRYVVLAHLKRGSLSVAVGDHLVPGSLIGQCGNSGNSSDPHLHMQVQTARHPLLGRAVRFTFRGHCQLPALATTIASTASAPLRDEATPR